MSTPYEKAIDYLSRREHSRLELKRKLRAKDFPEAEINNTLDQLIAKKFQSDERFTEAYVRYRKQAGFGPMKIAAELNERGVSDAIISAIINLNADEWRAKMISIWQKKFTNSSKDKSAQCRFLFSRGFPSEMINRFLFK
ncbi:MAG: regulatory protein RecX [Gammaproteobacteria bacterium]|nr:regulatory protein RecX [Gammaproteobacteria bacterium]